MIDVKVQQQVPPALKKAVIQHARRIGAPLSWVEEVLADRHRRLAFLGRDQPRLRRDAPVALSGRDDAARVKPVAWS